MTSCNHMCCHSCNGSRIHFSTRQCSASHAKGVTRLSPHYYYPSLACPIPRFFSNQAYLGSFGTASWASHEFVRTRGKVTANKERKMSHDIIQNLYASMTDQIASCIRARGGSTGETWTLNLETIRALETFERKALRTIFGPVKDQGCWRTRYNFELYRLYKEPQVTQVIRSNRLRWLGHIWRSHENNQTRAYTFKNSMGSRTRGRPPTRWEDDVENDLKTLNIKNWQRVSAYCWN
ncbi:endonuclease-reverse transcriptase [Trichonephila clavipes]|uniref:Endonuclease-reverse transcriptase n=1 Tax=Trichonephila clavipes TaxID=2585209 RepID=A0A8X6WG53_TRICX|nr:endonuclease-reverse transcriptase [Trichonephila clavipes]